MGNSKSSVHCNTLSTMSAFEPGRLASVRREPEQWIKRREFCNVCSHLKYYYTEITLHLN